ncbi:MAG: 3-isopropylmalate dehydratase large subunit [Euryarchaeota archaeon RBG_19FT_COMBO_69_17]|nr:MAG: 3-isopropylmalate dehydratase large subunit [Euryarchaeota archaeon RBG_19FT_COMBO_69_17]
MPGKTLVEKVLSHASGREVRAGDITIARVDLAYVQDGTGPLTFRQMEKMGLVKAANPARSIVFIDHSSPPPRKELASDHVYLRDFATKTGMVLSDVGEGVCHQVAFEKYVRPGEVAIGADSHTVMGGAMGAFATGMGSTDVAVALALGKTWLRVPESWRFEVTGSFAHGVYAKDLILRVIGDIKTDVATYMAMEWGGPAISKMPMTERMVLSNMAIEAGGKCGPQPSDEETRRYLREHGREADWREVRPDEDARYERTSAYDVGPLEPMVARPPQEDNVVPVTDPSVKGLRIHQVYLGSCTNARYEDIRVFCDYMRGEAVAKGTRLIVTPASKESYVRAMKEGLFGVLLDAGATINSPGCGACPGVHLGIPGDGENVLSTTNRNYVGRMGNPLAFTYLASPATAAATAMYGVITDPREV